MSYIYIYVYVYLYAYVCMGSRRIHLILQMRASCLPTSTIETTDCRFLDDVQNGPVACSIVLPTKAQEFIMSCVVVLTARRCFGSWLSRNFSGVVHSPD